MLLSWAQMVTTDAVFSFKLYPRCLTRSGKYLWYVILSSRLLHLNEAPNKMNGQNSTYQLSPWAFPNCKCCNDNNNTITILQKLLKKEWSLMLTLQISSGPTWGNRKHRRPLFGIISVSPNLLVLGLTLLWTVAVARLILGCLLQPADYWLFLLEILMFLSSTPLSICGFKISCNTSVCAAYSKRYLPCFCCPAFA